MKQGCSPLELNQDGNSSWAILFEKRSDEIFQLCKNSLDKNTFLPREKDGKNFLQKALEANESDWFQELMPLVNKESLFNLNEDGKSILHIAAAYSEEEIVERILEAKPELLNHVSKNKYSPLHTFCEYDQAKICKLVNKKFPNVDWDTKDKDGNSCLHYAVENDATQAIEFLISEKVDCTLLNNEGDSAFAIAVREKNHHSYKLIKTYLIEDILSKKESNPPLAENWIQFGKSQNIDSNANYHIGDAPDSRSVANARKNGVTINHIGRQLQVEDLDYFDLILAMDKSNLTNIFRLQTKEDQIDKIKLMREFDPLQNGEEVPDPYYGGDKGFQHVFDILERSTETLIKKLMAKN